MDHLWTPWRIEYLQKDEQPSSGCVFCAAPNMQDHQAHILHRGQFCYVMLNRFPYNEGHLMIIPYAHVPTPEELDETVLAEGTTLTQKCLRILQEAYQPQGFNIGLNIGAAGGAGIAEHIHLHIVPRWSGDTNYITTVGQTRIIPEWLDQTFERLCPLFQRSDTSNPNSKTNERSSANV